MFKNGDYMDKKYINEIARIIDDIKDINKQLNSQNPDIIELQKITVKAKKEFTKETSAYEAEQSVRPNTSFIPITQMSVDELMKRLPLYRTLYLNKLKNKCDELTYKKIIESINL